MVTDPSAEQDRSSGGVSDPEAQAGNRPERTYATTAVRYGYMNAIGEFTYPAGMKLSRGARLVVKTKRGIEVGEQVSLTHLGCDRPVARDQIQAYIRNSGPEYYEVESGRILREATPDDVREAAHLHRGTVDKRTFCQAVAERLKLPLKVVECEHLLGGERIIFYFLAEGRVDFRALVKELAVEYQTRIEMRQVGVRDEARLLADYETCGRECCCKAFLKTLRPVSMKMAKMQKATLDPSKVSGRCGRLKCCLRYEHVAYEELERNLPSLGVQVSTAHGDGVVVNRQILTQLVQVQGEDGKLFTVAIEDVGRTDGKHADGSGSENRTPAPADRPEKPAEQAPAQTAAEAESAPGEGRAPSNDEPVNGKPPRNQAARRKRRRRRRRSPDRPAGSGEGDTPAESE